MSDNVVYLTGGEQKVFAHFKQEWEGFKSARLMKLNLDTGAVETTVEYVSSPEVTVDQSASHLFKAGQIEDGVAHLCTNTELVDVELATGKVLKQISHPYMNDLHDVIVSRDDTLLVANTGLDCIVEMTRDGETLGMTSVTDEDVWERFDRHKDYRKVATTKPHQAHPNKVFELGGQTYATRFIQKDAIPLNGTGPRFEIGLDNPHDGHRFGDEIIFTTIRGYLSCHSPDGKLIRQINLADAKGRDKKEVALGWARGMCMLDDRHVAVGYTRLRPSRFREQMQIAKYALGKRNSRGESPTRIVVYDIQKNEQVTEFDLEPHGLNAVFAIMQSA